MGRVQGHLAWEESVCHGCALWEKKRKGCWAEQCWDGSVERQAGGAGRGAAQRRARWQPPPTHGTNGAREGEERS